MKTRWTWLLLLVLLSLIPLPIVAAQGGSPIDPYEGSDDFDEAYGPLQKGAQYAGYLGDLYDKDVYYFDVDETGTIEIYLNNVPDAYTYGLILYDKDQQIVDLDVESQGDKMLQFDMSFSGRYYLMVDVRFGDYDPNHPYLLSYQSEGYTEQATDAYEDNNTYATAWGPLESGETYKAYCWSQGDRDCYYFALSGDATVHVYLETVCDTCDYDLYLVNEEEEILFGSEQGRGFDESLSGQLTPGTYYVVVHPYQGYSQEEPYRLTVVYDERPSGPQPGNEAAWVRKQLESMGYELLYDPGVMEDAEGSLVAIAIEEPRSFDLRLEDDSTWRQATDTWGVLIQAFDAHYLAIALDYQDRYLVYYIVSSGDYGAYKRGELDRADLSYSYGVFDTEIGEWLTNAKDFIDKSFQ